MPRPSLLFAIPFVCISAAAQVTPALTGYVTSVGTPGEFMVNAVAVHCLPTTRLTLLRDGTHLPVQPCPPRSLGEELTIYGKRDKKSDVITATAIDGVAPVQKDVDGLAVIDHIMTDHIGTPPDKSGDIRVSADGYSITIPAAIHIAFEAPLTPQSVVTTNMWLKYSGVQHPDGSLTAKSASISLNILKSRERKVNEKAEFDPASVTEADKQGAVSKVFLGVNPKRFPATRDAEMQRRVQTIGETLIPAYQRDLPDSDPSKIDFRFQVVDQPKLHDAVTLSNGIILVPQQIVSRLKNDSQVATVLADNIACALEKQQLRLIPAGRAMGAGDVALIVGGAFVPGLALAGQAGLVTGAVVIMKREEEQSGRVSLVLLHRAGYDLAEAPTAWWILGSSKEKPLEKTGMSARAKYLYRILGTTWRQADQDSPAPAVAAR
jgi:hypothetical protein